MQWLRAPFFFLRLAVAVIPDLIFLIVSTWNLPTLGLALTVLAIAGASLAIQLPKANWYQSAPPTLVPAPRLSPTLPLAIPAGQAARLNTNNSTLTLEAWQTYLSSLQEQRVLHRDVLINLGILAWWLHQPDQAYDFWYQALQLDPSSPTLAPLFGEFSQPQR